MADFPKAARLGDAHLCPQHMGKDIISNVAPTILIEGKPAARITSKMTCIGGPLDTVAIGEPTVLMQGLDAARMLDGTEHGGLISQGAATVLVGTMSAMDKRMRLLMRLMLIDQAREKVAEMPPGPERDALLAAANRLAENNRVVEDARLAKDVYEDSGAPEGWARIDAADLPPEFKDIVLNDPNTGFNAAVYRSDIDGSYRLVFRGSESDNVQDILDWTTNAQQGTGNGAAQYNQAIALAHAFAQAYGPDNVGIVGHSLGGGLASAAALATGIHANTFNAAGLHPQTMQDNGILTYGFADGLIDTYKTDGELLTYLQEHSPGFISENMYDAAGTEHPMPAYDYDPTLGISTPREDVEFSLSADYLKALLAEAIHRHNNFIGGIEKQKADDIGTILTGLSSG